jgi:cytochrome c553
MNRTAKFCFTLVFSLLVIAPGVSLAKGNAATGQQKAATCEACHGKDGHSIDPTYPNLAGQHYSYLVKALSDYRSGDRSNPIMAGMAANLSNQDIEDLAAWYASQQGLKDLSVN